MPEDIQNWKQPWAMCSSWPCFEQGHSTRQSPEVPAQPQPFCAVVSGDNFYRFTNLLVIRVGGRGEWKWWAMHAIQEGNIKHNLFSLICSFWLFVLFFFKSRQAASHCIHCLEKILLQTSHFPLLVLFAFKYGVGDPQPGVMLAKLRKYIMCYKSHSPC